MLLNPPLMPVVCMWCLIVTLMPIGLMHSAIVNGYQLLYDDHTVPEQHRVTAALFYSLLSISVSSFVCFSL